ncbi:MAG: type II toxin-antitoxin system VapC family toxin [Gammaproteobacteria bacterium]|nr:type II toxin-antitoxin system VapC family toxin [Gammaproteobacteria bacterium]
MTRYLLDTNACIAMLNGSSPPLVARVRSHAPSDIGLSAVVLYELHYGANKSQRAVRNIELLDSLLFETIPFGREDARESGAIRAELERLGRGIGPYDLMIAGQGRARDLTVITANTREFERVSGLSIEDWAQTN